MTHTLGEWRVEGQDIIARGDNVVNGYICTWSGSSSDARLIAAAPKLLGIVKHILGCIERGEHFFCSETNRRDLQQAISKAEES